MTRGVPHEHGRVDNGLRAAAYVPLTDVDQQVGQQLLTALGRARIPAYLALTDPTGEQRRLFVASEDRVDARSIVAATVRSIDPGAGAGAAGDTAAPDADPLAGQDTDALFQALVADWHVDTHNAIKDAERDLTREDAEWRARLVRPPADDDTIWLDDDHYVPPPPPPLPRLAGLTILGIVVLALGIVLLGFGVALGFPGNVAFVLGIGGMLVGTGVLLTRVRDFHRDEDDDGAAL